MANYKNRGNGTNQLLQLGTGADYRHVDGGSALVTIVPTTLGVKLLRVINNSKGLGLNIRSGSRVVGTLATTTIEGSYNYGVFCDNGIQIDVSGSGSATVVFG